MDSNAELFAAIDRGDVDQVRALLAAGADPDAVLAEWPGWRPLHAAIDVLEEGRPLETVVALLSHGATVDGWDPQHDATPLLMAVFRGQPEAIRLLLDAGADVNVRGSEGDSPLRWAVQAGDLVLARLLLEHGAARDIDASGGPTGMNALGRAARNLDVPMVQLLLEAGARPDAPDADSWIASRRVQRPDNAEALERWRQVMALLGEPPQP
jgi:ankyrin repeat protein